MRLLKSFVVLVVLLASGNVLRAESESKEVIYIKSERFAAPLIQKWIEEYKKVNHNADIRIADKNIETKDIRMQLITAEKETKAERNQSVNTWGRYALLPIANKESVLLNKNKLNEKTLKAIFFEQNLLDEKAKEDVDPQATVYSGAGASSFSAVFASYLGSDGNTWRGKRIAGDDVFLINAIQKDAQGVTVNSLNYIYDLTKQEIKENISILPIATKKEHKEILEKGELENVINLLENERIDLIPVGYLGFKYEKSNSEVRAFAKWILSEGISFNHSFGFLKPDKEALAEEISKLEKFELTSQN